MTVALSATGGLGVLAGLAPGFESLLVLRALEGVVIAALPATAMVYLTEEVHSHSLGMAMGLYVSGNTAGGKSGRIISGVLADNFARTV